MKKDHEKRGQLILLETFFTLRRGGPLKKVSRAKPAYRRPTYRRQAGRQGAKEGFSTSKQRN